MKAQVLKQFEMRLANVFKKQSVIKECLFWLCLLLWKKLIFGNAFVPKLVT